MKDFVSRKFFIIICSLLLVACVPMTSKQATGQEIKTQKRIKDDAQLYEICKNDLEQQNFENTPCGMYLKGYRTSFIIFLMPFIPISAAGPSEELDVYEGSGNQTMDAMLEIFGSSCKSGLVSTKKAAEDFIFYVENELKNPEKSKAAEEGFFWDYFLSCGNPSLVREKLHK